MSLRVVSHFGEAVSVREPRFGGLRHGVPVGGAFDRESYGLAVALAGLPDGAEAWEIALGEAKFYAATRMVVGIAGCVGEVSVDAKPHEAGQVRLTVEAGQELLVRVGRQGARAYVSATPGQASEIRLADEPQSLCTSVLRVISGPQADLVPLAERWTVSAVQSRAGIRLEGEKAPHGHELTSEPACVGAIQVTGDGTPIIIGPDGPTICGYPKAAAVCSADLDKVGQLHPGQELELRWVGLEEARELWSAEVERRAAVLTQIRLAL